MRFFALLLVVCAVCGSARADGPLISIPGLNTKHSASSSGKSQNILTKMTSPARRLLTSTKNLLVPKKNPQENKAKVTSVRRHGKEKPQQGFFTRLFQGPPPPPRTMKEWMDLEQIHP